jgi:hypothetical protein
LTVAKKRYHFTIDPDAFAVVLGDRLLAKSMPADVGAEPGGCDGLIGPLPVSGRNEPATGYGFA